MHTPIAEDVLKSKIATLIYISHKLIIMLINLQLTFTNKLKNYLSLKTRASSNKTSSRA